MPEFLLEDRQTKQAYLNELRKRHDNYVTGYYDKRIKFLESKAAAIQEQIKILKQRREEEADLEKQSLLRNKTELEVMFYDALIELASKDKKIVSTRKLVQWCKAMMRAIASGDNDLREILITQYVEEL